MDPQTFLFILNVIAWNVSITSCVIVKHILVAYLVDLLWKEINHHFLHAVSVNICVLRPLFISI